MTPVSKKICIHHIGGRDGHFGFATPPLFQADFINVLYDADPDCIEQIRCRHQGPTELHVLPYCIGKKTGQAVFNLNYDPYTSSLIDSNPEFDSYYYFDKPLDYLYGDTARTMEKRAVEVFDLDFLARSQDVQAPPPDFLSIDTQGSEYEILEGADSLLDTSILAVALEIEFAPMYKDQKLFGDLCRLLAAKGFHFVKFLRLGELAPVRSAVGLRADGFIVHGDALFLRRVDHVDVATAAGAQQARKLAFLALMYHQMEFALSCLQALGGAHAASRRGGEQLAYEQFLDELERATYHIEPRFPPTFAECFSFADSKARFQPVEPAAPVACARVEPTPLLRKLRKIPTKLRKIPTKLKAWFKKPEPPVLPPNSCVEDLLEKYGLFELKEKIKDKRLTQLPWASQIVKRSA